MKIRVPKWLSDNPDYQRGLRDGKEFKKELQRLENRVYKRTMGEVTHVRMSGKWLSLKKYPEYKP